jgi:inosine-uridine nucleoside N-ribohydrolase
MPYNRKQGHAVKEDGKVAFLYDVPDYKKIRVILDTDAACEADDPFAIVQALLSPKLMVKGILAEHFREQGSMEKSYQEILTILDCMGMDASLAHRGQEGPMDTSGVKQETCDAQKNFPELSEGVKFLIEEAMKEDERPLYVLCQGAITNVAVAMQACPEIIQRMTVIWIGTHGEAPHPAPFREFNAGNDITAANLVLSCGGDIWIVPSTVYTTILIGIAEIQKKDSALRQNWRASFLESCELQQFRRCRLDEGRELVSWRFPRHRVGAESRLRSFSLCSRARRGRGYFLRGMAGDGRCQRTKGNASR